ncbi:MAG TPA: succinate dehydrogenase iron-sulfur subunit [Thermodesulfobacteriota bacterium]|nr:succinate dehydrogenase iron-sulfur subunit [Thermodesulfobacteriota bacterium]
MPELRFKIFRYDPKADKGPYYKHYKVQADPDERILDCLNRIKWEQDGTLSYRMSCGHGVCGSDGMKINGTCRLACQALVKDYQCPEIVIEPLPVFKVLKDLVVDIDPFLSRIGDLRPFLVADPNPPEKERLQSPEERKKLDEVIRCILCACCTSSCPVNWRNEHYVGPAALVWAFRYIFDSRDRDTADRLKQVAGPDGAKGCVNYFECTRVCPKEIPITRSINLIKRALGSESREKSSP